MKHIVKTEADWHVLRDKCITASEAAVLVGMDPYGSPGKLKKASTFTGNASTLVGQLLEPVVVKIVNIRLEADFQLYEDVEGGKAFFTKELLGATPDAVWGDWLLECKTTRPDIFLKYKEEPPTKYLTQLQTQMYCTDKHKGYLAILSTDLTQKAQTPSWPIVIYQVNRCDSFCDYLQQEAARFYEEEKFRVNSEIKKHCGELLKQCYTKIEVKEVSMFAAFLKEE